MRKLASLLVALGGVAVVAVASPSQASPDVAVYRADLGAVPHDPAADAGSDASGNVVLVLRGPS